MTPINSTTIENKLFRLNENIKFIDDVLRKSDKDVLADRPLYYGLQHLLQISIEIILDIGSNILAEEFGINPKTYADVILALGEKNIIGQKFAEEQAEMAKFRNILVHDYDNLDDKKVLEYSRAASEIFRLFGKAFNDFLNKKQTNK